MNGVDIVIIILIAAAVILAVLGIRKSRRNGNSCCGNSCSGNCAHCGASCKKAENTNESGRS